MPSLTNSLQQLRRASHERRSDTTARKRFANYLRFERLEDRRLLAVVSHWTGDNTSLDAVGSNHASLISGATYAAGQVNSAFSFDGVNDRVQVADSPSLKLTHSLSIEAWVNCTSLPTEQSMILFRGDDRSGLDPYVLNVKPDGTVRFEIASLTGGTGVQTRLPLNQFVHIAATLDDATGEMDLYINAVLLAHTTTAVRPFANLDPNSSPGIGIGNHGGYPTMPHNFPFHGRIDEIIVYDEALSAEQVLSQFNAGKGSLSPIFSIDDAAVTEGDSRLGSSLGVLVDQIGNGGLNRSTGMVFGPDGNLYVGSLNTNEVLRYDAATGAFLGAFVTAGSGGLTTPAMQGLSFRPDGKLYVASRDNSSVLRFNATTGAFIDTFIASNSGGLQSPKGMTFGPDGNLYLSSTTNEVLRYNGITGAFLGKFVSAGSGGLTNPRFLTFGPDGNLYVVSSDNDSVLKYHENTGGFLGTLVASASGGLDFPAELLFHDGNLYVASQNTSQVLCYDSTSGAYIDVAVASGNGLDRPNGLVLDADNNLLVGGNSAIHRYGTKSNASFTVRLNAPFPTPVSVYFATSDVSAMAGGDYTATSGTLVFAPGSFTKSVAVQTQNDSTGESRESFTVNLSGAVGGTIADGSAIGTIKDDDATRFYVVNDASSGDRTYEYADGSNSIENYGLNSGNSKPRGAASNIAGDRIWVADANKKVYVYNNAGSPLGSWTAGSLSSKATVEGVATNGTDVWIVDSYSDKVYRYANAASKLSNSQNAASSFSLNSSNKNPKGIVTDGTHLWVVNDSTTDKVFQYTPSGSLVGSWTIDSANKYPTGLTIDPTGGSPAIWIVDSGTDKIYEYTNGRTRTSGSQAADVSFALAAGNTNPQGIADPPPTDAPMTRSTAAALALGKVNQPLAPAWMAPSSETALRPIDVSVRQSSEVFSLPRGVDEFMGRLGDPWVPAARSASVVPLASLGQRRVTAQHNDLGDDFLDRDLDGLLDVIAQELAAIGTHPLSH